MNLKLRKKYLFVRKSDGGVVIMAPVARTEDGDFYLMCGEEGRRKWISAADIEREYRNFGEIIENNLPERYSEPIIPSEISLLESEITISEGSGFVIRGETMDGKKASIIVRWGEPIEIKSEEPLITGDEDEPDS